MNVQYSAEIDKKIHDEVNEMGPKLAATFGFEFPVVQFDDGKKAQATQVAEQATRDNVINETRAAELLKQIFGIDLPAVAVYVNTTPFSTWNTEEQYISLSISRFPERAFASFCHEANHYLYDTLFSTKKYAETASKETVTVLNTMLGLKDHGWPALQEARKEVLSVYESTHSFSDALAYARKAQVKSAA